MANTLQVTQTAGAVASDGSVIAGGWISYSAGQQHSAVTLLRWHADGTPDSGFGNNGVAQLDLNPAPQVHYETIYAISPQPDGKLLVVAGVQIPDQLTLQPVLLSVRADGTPDTAFGPGGMRSIDIATWSAQGGFQTRTAIFQPDGKVLLGCTLVTGSASYYLIGRALPSASLDTDFSADGWQTNVMDGAGNRAPQALAVDDLGRILIAGTERSPAKKPLIMRLTSNGEFDTSFGALGDGSITIDGLDGDWTANAIVAAKRTLGGLFVHRRYFVAINGSIPNRTAIAAIANDGTVSTSFGDDGFVDLTREERSSITALAMRNDLRLVGAGFIDPNGNGSSTDIFVARLDFDGALDPAFDGNGVERYPLDPDVLTYDNVAALQLSGERPVIFAAAIDTNTPRWYGAVLRLQSDLIFANGLQ